ncbi:unnamed protein product [Fraxinus pennsylvanica]|uniref:Peptidase A1 domain-containing protein n=1 Tax=Fraxinus pennsylvanica TaxID=56036 RepID=A0AAD1ZNB9_9LAMI|nr:unnamed protein product [Fraxinus pennsylvanica]
MAKKSFRPKALVLPVTKDPSTLQYVTQIEQRTPLVPIKLSIHLGGQTLWVDCENGYNSSSYRSARCRSAQCSIAKSHACGDCFTRMPKIGCSNNACYNTPDNPAINTFYDGGEISEDVLSIQSTNGFNPGQLVNISRFIFSCVPSFLTAGLANGVKGTAGLGGSLIALPSQLARVFGFQRKFAICLSSSTRSNGIVFFGNGPYVLLPGIDASKSLSYTPLIKNPFGIGSVPFLNEPSSEYFIGLKSIRINGKSLQLNKTLLSIDKEGNGGTKISTFRSYTVMQTSIYNALITAFNKELANVTRVVPVAPFGVCFDSKNIGSTRVGPAVPPIDLIFKGNKVYWSIFGANSMVQVNEDVMCLGFVDGGENLVTSIVIGGHQIEDNLLQFDLDRSRLGFSSSLLFRQTTCANFNFTSLA